MHSMNDCGFVGVYYFEKWFQDVCRNAMLAQSEESIALRECAEKARQHIAIMQSGSLDQISA